ncbi:MAG TPA: DUF4062 domain-containing protein, partial [Phycisphaerae bacterium]|nr:DUF4062 domain-containing protein [Phycisphaerae bacterium]
MAKNVTVIRIFLSSPGDVVEEREIVETVAREINNSFGDHLSLRLEVVKWETHIVPSFGSDPQDVINTQIGGDYDIFLGIMSTRFGTPTPRAGSGTEEEFARAYQKHVADPSSIRIMFYFKSAKVCIYDLDLTQVGRIQKFRESLGERGGLYWEYKDEDEFRNYVRLHLTEALKTWGKSWGTSAASVRPRKTAEDVRHDIDFAIADDEPGLLDLMEETERHFNAAAESLELVLTATTSLTADLNEATEDLSPSRDGLRRKDLADQKRVINRGATSIDDFARKMQGAVAVYAERQAAGFGALSHAIVLAGDFAMGPEERETMLELDSTLEG